MTRLINVTYYVEMNICRWYDYNKHLAMYFVFFLRQQVNAAATVSINIIESITGYQNHKMSEFLSSLSCLSLSLSMMQRSLLYSSSGSEFEDLF